MISPRTPSGVLELLPQDQIAFNRMLDVVRHAFESYGFVPISTPRLEYTDILLTKTGGETERQVYFVESLGNLEKRGESAEAATKYPDLTLPFDLTVPLARYVAQYERQLAFPFRRYQIQPVFRGERAQRGRFREFYQCDIDIIGKDRLDVRYDAEPVACFVDIYTAFGFGPFTVWINNRKLLRGFLAYLGIDDKDQQTVVLREVDKVDKIGVDKLRASLSGLGISDAGIDAILALMGQGPLTWEDAVPRLNEFKGKNETLDSGIAELAAVAQTLHAMGVNPERWKINFALARGLDYYTGTIYEVRLDDYPQLGSVGGGGRYDNLAGNYTKSALPGVGISLGLTRLFWQLKEVGLINNAQSCCDVLITLMDQEQLPATLSIAQHLRAAGLNVEAVLEPTKLAKQFKYADKAGMRFVIVCGADEVKLGKVTLKDLQGGSQQTHTITDVVAEITRLKAGGPTRVQRNVPADIRLKATPTTE